MLPQHSLHWKRHRRKSFQSNAPWSKHAHHYSLLNHSRWERKMKMWHLEGIPGGQWHSLQLFLWPHSSVTWWRRWGWYFKLILSCFWYLNVQAGLEAESAHRADRENHQRAGLDTKICWQGFESPRHQLFLINLGTVYRCIYWPQVTFYSRSCTFII